MVSQKACSMLAFEVDCRILFPIFNRPEFQSQGGHMPIRPLRTRDGRTSG